MSDEESSDVSSPSCATRALPIARAISPRGRGAFRWLAAVTNRTCHELPCRNPTAAHARVRTAVQQLYLRLSCGSTEYTVTLRCMFLCGQSNLCCPLCSNQHELCTGYTIKDPYILPCEPCVPKSNRFYVPHTYDRLTLTGYVQLLSSCIYRLYSCRVSVHQHYRITEL